MGLAFTLQGRSPHSLTYTVQGDGAPQNGDLLRTTAATDAMAGPLKAVLQSSYTLQNWFELRVGNATLNKQPIVSAYPSATDTANAFAVEFLNDGGGANVIRGKMSADGNGLLELRFNHTIDR